jgi:hypothetical protein
MNPSDKNFPKQYRFRPLKRSDLEPIAEWIGTLAPPGELAWENILRLLKQHQHLMVSPWAKSWMMEVNKQPAFVINLNRNLGPWNWLRMITAPSIRRNKDLLMRAWQAASIVVFLQEGLDEIAVEVLESMTEENECLLTLGFRIFNRVPESFGVLNQYTCSPKEFTPVF